MGTHTKENDPAFPTLRETGNPAMPLHLAGSGLTARERAVAEAGGHYEAWLKAKGGVK